MTTERLRASALAYLARYSASRGRLHGVLQRRVRRAIAEGLTPADEAEAMIAETVERMAELGFVDDAAYAGAKVRMLRQRGASSRRVRMELKRDGIDDRRLEQALDENEESGAGAELEAAAAYARRRRLGPWRAGEDRESRRDRDLAALARQGFSLSLAREVIDAPDRDALDVAIEEARTTDLR